MINILMSGCSGHMGKCIAEMVSGTSDMKISAGFDIIDSKPGFPVYSDLSKLKEEVDVIIDFSNPAAFKTIFNFAVSGKIPIVIATTGLNDEQKSSIKAGSMSSPVFFASNMSLGINLLLDLVSKAAKVLESGFDVEIVERHHNLKVDSPSGTAITIAETVRDAMVKDSVFVYDRHSVRKKRADNEIGLHAVRGGTIVGEHDVIFAGTDEVIEIKHSAGSKKIFAAGALKAARFMYNKKPGYYSMNDVLK